MNKYRRKVANSILEAIMGVEAKTRSQQISKMEYMINFHKIMEDYDNVLRVLQESNLVDNMMLGKSGYRLSEFDTEVFDNIIEAVQQTMPQEGKREELIEQADYMKNLNAIMLDYPNVIKTLIEMQNKKDWGDIDF